MAIPVYEEIADMILESKMTVVLTGAGISTESGIPDFRSPNSGLWEKVDPMEALSKEVLYNKPDVFYNVGFKILGSMRGAKPNKAHIILSKMEKEGYIDSIITQNIDNLHYEAGSVDVMEVHGNLKTMHCLKCGAKYDYDVVEEKIMNEGIPPICHCGGVIRTDVVLFGDSLPKCFDRAWRKAQKADLMIVVGSSLQVSPVNYLPSLSKKLIIINYGETAQDSLADILYREKASSALVNIYNKLKEKDDNTNGK